MNVALLGPRLPLKHWVVRQTHMFCRGEQNDKERHAGHVEQGFVQILLCKTLCRLKRKYLNRVTKHVKPLLQPVTPGTFSCQLVPDSSLLKEPLIYQQDGKTKKEGAGHGWVYILYCCAKTAARSKSAAPSPQPFSRAV